MQLEGAATAAFVLLSRPPAAPGVEPSRAQLDFFEQKVRPVLVEHCYRCHSADAGKSKGGLTLDSRDAVLKGGDTGPAVVAGGFRRCGLLGR